MRILLRAATMAALCFFASAGGALADGWGDGSPAYRNLSWSGTTRDVDSRAAASDEYRPQRRARTVEASDEDRPQHRSRTARADRSHVARGSIASDSEESAQSRSRHASSTRQTRSRDTGSGGSVGMASYYWQGQRVASGGRFNPNAMTAAHKSLPFGTRVRVTHMGNGRSVDVTINDRGPYVGGRIIDLSRAAASAINMTGQGVAKIRMTVLGR
jgi:rare lipoprotein A